MTMLELNSTCPIQSLVDLIEYFVGQIRLEYFLNCIIESSFVCLFPSLSVAIIVLTAFVQGLHRACRLQFVTLSHLAGACPPP